MNSSLLFLRQVFLIGMLEAKISFKVIHFLGFFLKKNTFTSEKHYFDVPFFVSLDYELSASFLY